MPISRGSVVQMARALLREKTTDSYDTSDLNTFFRATYRFWSLETLWPQSIWISDPGTTTAGTQSGQILTGGGTQVGVQEYALPENINMVMRVYVQGNRLKPVTIPVLEGDVRQVYDPTWRILPNVTVPDMTQQLPVSGTGAIPITAGAPPNLGIIPPNMGYYIRGGSIGIVPPPGAVYIFKIEGASMPADVADDATSLVFPPQWEYGLAAGTAKLVAISDDKQQGAQVMAAIEKEQLDLCKYWRRSFQGDLQTFMQPLGYRSYFGRRWPVSQQYGARS